MQTVNLNINRFDEEDINDFTELIRDKMSSEYSMYDNLYPTDDDSLKAIEYSSRREPCVGSLLPGTVAF